MTRTWLARRAALALLLMVGFYVLAMGITAVLLWVPYAELRYLHRVDKISLLCVGAAGTLLWSLAPRRDVFEAPGPQLDPSAHPHLFKTIDEIASSTGEAPPAEVYLVNQVNAWVTQRGGVMGLGSRRVMGIGLPLLQSLTRSEFRAVVAHEFGHYQSGDVALGPWIHRTRSSIGRTIAGMDGSVLQAPFVWYGRLFLKLTHAVSRQQEFTADAVAVRVAGAGAQWRALRKVTSASAAFDAYMRNEVMPVVQAGYLPPIASGFQQFTAVPEVSSQMDRLVRQAEASTDADEFDTHPPLKERLAALGVIGPAMDADDGESAATLLVDPDAAARALLEHGIGREPVERLRPIEWDTVGDTVYVAVWRKVVSRYAAQLASSTAGSIPADKDAWIRFAAQFVEPGEPDCTDDARVDRATYVVGAAVACALLDRGWSARTAPGTSVRLVKGEQTFDVFGLVREVVAGSLDSGGWRDRCLELGILDARLGPTVAA